MNNLINIKDSEKTIILRVDFNVAIKDGRILDDYKIVRALKTINFLISKNKKIIILSHLGKVTDVFDEGKNSLRPVAKRLSELINKKVYFFNNCYGEELKKEVDKINAPSIILLENTRLMDIYERAESNNKNLLVQYWSSLGDAFVFDAFATSHRVHASTSGLFNAMKSYKGFLVFEEEGKLNEIINPPHPFTIILGGSKVETKLSLIEKLLDKCDYFIPAGGILNSFLKATGVDVGSSVSTKDFTVLDKLNSIIIKNKEKILLSSNLFKEGNSIKDVYLEEFQEIISKSKTIFVNGTPGIYEEEKTNKGTINLFEMLSKTEGKVFLGGGDAVAASNMFGYKNFYYYSTGGGATLSYLINENTLF